MNEKKILGIYKTLTDNEIYFEYNIFHNLVSFIVYQGEVIEENVTKEELINRFGITIDDDNLKIIDDFIRIVRSYPSGNQISIKCEKDNINRCYLVESFPRNENDKVVKGIIKNLYGIVNDNEKLLELSKTDSLTGIFNRLNIEEYVNNLIKENKFFCFVMIDIDYFKKINDTYGHVIGDGVLREIARLLKKTVSNDGNVGRIGGDEFVLIKTYDHMPSVEEKRILCRSIRNQIYESRETKTIMKYVTITMGLTVHPFDGNTYQNLYLKADKALYKGKFKGRDCYVLYIDDLHKNINTEKKVSDISLVDYDKNISISSFISSINTSLLYNHSDENIKKNLLTIANYFKLDRITFSNYSCGKYNVDLLWNKKEVEMVKPIDVVDQELFLKEFEKDSTFIVSDISDYLISKKNKNKPVEIDYSYGSFVIVACGRKNITDLLLTFEVIGDRRIWMRQQLDGIVVIAKMLASFYLYEKDETKN